MKKFTLNCQNHGGIDCDMLYAAPAAETEIMYDIFGYGYLMVDHPENVIQIPCIRDTAMFDEKKEFSRQGDKYTVTVSGTIAGDAVENKDYLTTLDSGRWIVIIRDNNGVIRICGDTDTPMTFNRESATNAGFTARNNHLIEFSSIQNHSCYYDQPPFDM